MDRKLKARVRQALVLVHRWFGLLAGIWLLFLAVTGIFLVFHEEVDHALNRDLFNRPVVGERLPYEALVRNVEAEWGGSYARFVDLPNEPWQPLVVFLGTRPDAESPMPRRLNVLVDPYTGEVLGSRSSSAGKIDRLHFARWVYDLHINLHSGKIGKTLLGIVALWWLFDHLPAVWLSFPKLHRWWRSFFTKRSSGGMPQVYGLHRALGLWLVPVTLVLAISGLYFNLRPLFYGTVEFFSPISQPFHQTVPALNEPIFAPRVTLDEALKTASLAAGGAAVDRFSILPKKGLYWVRIFDPRDLADYGQRYIYVSMVDGTVVHDHHLAVGSTADTFLALQLPLHSGRAFDWPGRLLIATTGLVVCVLVTTGFMLWIRKRRGRRRARRSS